MVAVIVYYWEPTVVFNGDSNRIVQLAMVDQ
jgi:hypothetical protein